jgi:hypothetical protein
LPSGASVHGGVGSGLSRRRSPPWRALSFQFDRGSLHQGLKYHYQTDDRVTGSSY